MRGAKPNSFSSHGVAWYLQCTVYGGLILYFGRGLFIPISYALLISFVLYPVCRWLESKGFGRLYAIALALLLLFALSGALVALLVGQVLSFVNEWPSLQAKFQQAMGDVSDVLSDVFGISLEKQKRLLSENPLA